MVHLSLARGQTAGIHPHNTTSHWTLEKLFNNPSFLSDMSTCHFLAKTDRYESQFGDKAENNTEHTDTLDFCIKVQVINHELFNCLNMITLSVN